MRIDVKVTLPNLAGIVRSRVDRVKPQALYAIAAFARDRLVSEAQANLKGFAQTEYIKALQSPEAVSIEGDKAIVRLAGDLPVSIEQGSPSWSIKDKMLAKATKHSKDGKAYVDVPFRHGMGDTKVLAGVPASVASSMHQAVRKAQSVMRAGGASKQEASMAPARMSGRTPGVTVTKSLQPTGAKLTTTHKQGIYDDMMRVPKLYAKRVQGTYMTIRRISENSSPSSWIHPGFPGAKFFDKVIAEVRSVAPRIVKDLLAEAK